MRHVSVLLAMICATNAYAATEDSTKHAGALAAPVATVAMATPVQAAAMRNVALPAGSLISINAVVDLTSKTLKLGDKVKFATVGDVTQDGMVIIPGGTPGEGVVSYVQGTGRFGRSGKLEVTFTALDLGGRKILLTGKHRREGAGNTGATVGAIVAAGVIGGLIVSGHSAVIKHDETLQAHTTAEEAFAQPAGGPSATLVTVSMPAAPIAPTH